MIINTPSKGSIKVLKLEARHQPYQGKALSPLMGELTNLGLLKLAALAAIDQNENIESMGNIGCGSRVIGFVCRLDGGKKKFIDSENPLFEEIVQSPDFPYGQIPENAGNVLSEMASNADRHLDADSFRELAEAYKKPQAGLWDAGDWLDLYAVPEGTTKEQLPELIEQLLQEAAQDGVTFDEDEAEKILSRQIEEEDEEEDEEEEEALA